jgi:hypothetical protein
MKRTGLPSDTDWQINYDSADFQFLPVTDVQVPTNSVGDAPVSVLRHTSSAEDGAAALAVAGLGPSVGQNWTMADTQSGAGGDPSSVSVSSATGFTINLIYDAAAMAAPASFRAGIQQAANILASTITDHITVNLKIDYSGSGGGASAGPDAGLFESYSSIRNLLITNASPGDTTFNSLPAGSSIQGQSQVAVWNAQLKLYGLLSPNDTSTADGSAQFSTGISSSLLVGVALHELTHALGRIPYGPQPDIFDLFRFTGPGTHLFDGSVPTSSAAYFSLDGGNTRLADYGVHSDPSDFLNPGPTFLGGPYSNLTPNDPFNEIYDGSTSQQLSAIDLKQLDALGFHLASANHPPVVSLPSGANVAASSRGQVFSLSSLFTASDADNDPLTYMVLDNTVGGGSGHFNINGVAQTEGSWVGVTAAQLSQVTFTAGLSHSDDLYFYASDGKSSDVKGLNLMPAPNHPPIISLPSAANVGPTSHTQTFALSSLFTASDGDGDPLSYMILDNTVGAGSGHFSIGGVAQTEGGWIGLTAAQLSQVTFTPGFGHSDDLYFYASDGAAYDLKGLNMLAAPNHAPVIAEPSGANIGASSHGQVFQFSSLFTASDADNDPLTYMILDNTAGGGSGHFNINGVAQAEGGWIGVTAAQLSQTTFTAGQSGSDNLYFYAADAGSSDLKGLNLMAAPNHAPVIAEPNGANVATSSHAQVIALSSLFTASDADNDALTYMILDNSVGGGSGHFNVGGVAQPEGQWIGLTAAQLSQTSFTSGVSHSDNLYFYAADSVAFDFKGLHLFSYDFV